MGRFGATSGSFASTGAAMRLSHRGGSLLSLEAVARRRMASKLLASLPAAVGEVIDGRRVRDRVGCAPNVQAPRGCASWANGRDLTRIFGSGCMHHDSGKTVVCGSLQCVTSCTQDENLQAAEFIA